MPDSITLTMPPDCDLRAVGALRDAMLAALGQGRDLTLDCAGVARADVAFVQLVVAADQSARRRGVTLTLTNQGADVEAAFRRAGLAPAGGTTPSI